MKTLTYYSALLLCLLCFSCKKEHSQTSSITPSEKLYPVTFSLASFNQTVHALHQASTGARVLSAATLKDSIDVLYYYVYNPTTMYIVRRLSQNSSQANFGTIKDSIAAGTYNILIAAGKSGLYSYPTQDGAFGKHSLADIYFNYQADTAYNLPPAPWKDVFFKMLTVTVPAAVNQQVSLDRIVAQLQVDITDSIPSNAAKLDVVISNDAISTYYGQNPTVNPGISSFPYSPVYSVPVTAAMVNKTNTILTTYTMNTFTPFNVTLNAYDALNKRIATKTVVNVTCKQNMRTLLTGKLFNANTTVGIGVGTNVVPVTTVNSSF